MDTAGPRPGNRLRSASAPKRMLVPGIRQRLSSRSAMSFQPGRGPQAWCGARRQCLVKGRVVGHQRSHGVGRWIAARRSAVAASSMAVAADLERIGLRSVQGDAFRRSLRLSHRRTRFSCGKAHDRVGRVMPTRWRAGAPERTAASRAMHRGRADRCRSPRGCRPTRHGRRRGRAIAPAPARPLRRRGGCGYRHARRAPARCTVGRRSPACAGCAMTWSPLRGSPCVPVAVEHDGRDDRGCRGRAAGRGRVRLRPAAWRRRPRACRAPRRRPGPECTPTAA